MTQVISGSQGMFQKKKIISEFYWQTHCDIYIYMDYGPLNCVFELVAYGKKKAELMQHLKTSVHINMYLLN